MWILFNRSCEETGPEVIFEFPNTTQEWMLKRISDGQFPTPGGHWPMPGVTKTPPFFELILGGVGG